MPSWGDTRDGGERGPLLTEPDGQQYCDWSAVCDRWPVHHLERVEWRQAPVERIVVCHVHLLHAQAKGFRLAHTAAPAPPAAGDTPTPPAVTGPAHRRHD